ncbi:hypothetical protein BDU57DRAFT_113764 [Ampelomyces quisqualis]|uniref:Uncharacterized protein n=1 Tax=Ampelomyces quisqualis TaxID=50730 RepID=A0A6A5Q9E6_AMPQU|nr:hypothetical protein BDU57DRAFT_113764 [Ampelomyces quisqualis]
MIHRREIYNHPFFFSLSCAVPTKIPLLAPDHQTLARRRRCAVSRNHRTRQRLRLYHGRHAPRNVDCVKRELFPSVREQESTSQLVLTSLTRPKSRFDVSSLVKLIHMGMEWPKYFHASAMVKEWVVGCVTSF